MFALLLYPTPHSLCGCTTKKGKHYSICKKHKTHI